MSEEWQDIRVDARTAVAMPARRGQVLRVVDVAGKQVGDLVAFCQGDFTEWLSATHTRSALSRLSLSVGDELRSNRRRSLFRILSDDVRVHDLLLAMCDAQRYRDDYGLDDHGHCRGNLTSAFAPWGMQDWQIPDPVNLFQNTPIDSGGRLGMEEPRSRAGDAIALEVLVDVVVGVSACPQDQNPCNGWHPSDLLVQLSEPGP